MWNPVTQPAKVMSRYISVVVRSAQFTWNELPQWSAFFSQPIHPILAGLIFNIIPFFLGIFFSQFDVSLKKKKNQNEDEATASYGPGSFYKLIIDPHNNLLPVGLLDSSNYIRTYSTLNNITQFLLVEGNTINPKLYSLGVPIKFPWKRRVRKKKWPTVASQF